MFKKLSGFIVLLCGSPLLAFAGQPGNTMTPPSGVVLTAPTTPGIWTVGLEAQLMMPLDQFQYTQAVLAQPDGSTLLHNETEDNEKDWGWEADVAYQFANTGRDIRVAYTDLNMSDDEGYSATAGTVLYGPNGRSNTLVMSDGALVIGTAAYHDRAADLTVGQLLNVGNRVNFHPFAGLRYGNISIVGDAKYYDNTGPEDKFESDSTFSGAGPRAGMDVAVKLCWGFSIVGTFGSSLLMGDMNDDYKISNNVQAGGLTTSQDNKDADIFSVVPELDESFGLNYRYAFNQTTALDAQFGAQVVNYFNADQHDYLGTADVNSSLGSENFGYHGLYFRTQFSFA